MGRLTKSGTLSLLYLVGVVVMTPIPLFVYVDRIESYWGEMLAAALHQRDGTVGAALAPILSASDNPADDRIGDVLAHYVGGTTRRWVFYTPGDAVATASIKGGTYASPGWSKTSTGAFDEAMRLEILRSLPALCSPRATDRSLSALSPAPFISVTPITGSRGCWLLVSAELPPSLLVETAGQPLRESWIGRFLIAGYLIIVGIAVIAAWRLYAGLRNFSTIAYHVGQRRVPVGAAVQARPMLELEGAAQVIDGFALDMRRVSESIRRTAEDNTHSLKTPLAVVRTAVARIRRLAPTAGQPVQQALAAADQAIDRLFLLITASQRLDEDTAALIVAPRQPLKVAQLVEEALRQFSDVIALKRIQCVPRLDRRAMVDATAGHLETVIRNILGNAINSLPEQSTIVITLGQNKRTVELRFEDDAGGMPVDAVEHLFQRDYSMTSGPAGVQAKPRGHARPGLFVVKRNVEALGGSVVAENVDGGGFSITVVLPRMWR